MEEKRGLDILTQSNMIKLIICAEGALLWNWSVLEHVKATVARAMLHLSDTLNQRSIKRCESCRDLIYFTSYFICIIKNQLGKQLIYFSNSFSPVTSTVSLQNVMSVGWPHIRYIIAAKRWCLFRVPLIIELQHCTVHSLHWLYGPTISSRDCLNSTTTRNY